MVLSADTSFVFSLNRVGCLASLQQALLSYGLPLPDCGSSSDAATLILVPVRTGFVHPCWPQQHVSGIISLKFKPCRCFTYSSNSTILSFARCPAMHWVFWLNTSHTCWPSTVLWGICSKYFWWVGGGWTRGFLLDNTSWQIARISSCLHCCYASLVVLLCQLQHCSLWKRAGSGAVLSWWPGLAFVCAFTVCYCQYSLASVATPCLMAPSRQQKSPFQPLSAV